MKCRIQLPIPKAASDHMYQRFIDGRISEKTYFAILRWIQKQPLVPINDWYKRFNDGYLVGTGPVPTSILSLTMIVNGEEVF